MDKYEVPSGGDWSIHRGGAFFVENAENVSIFGCQFVQLGGNGLFVSNYAENTVAAGNVFHDIGDSGNVH